MSDAIAFEYRGKTIGVLTRDGDAFVFHSDGAHFQSLDGRRFSEPRDLFLTLQRLEADRRVNSANDALNQPEPRAPAAA